MSDTQSAPCGVGGFGFVPIAIDHHKIPDELRGDVARLLDRLGIANSYIDALEARVAELEARCKRLEEALNNVELVMQRPASNHRMMQIAEPARRVLNIIKQVKDSKP